MADSCRKARCGCFPPSVRIRARCGWKRKWHDARDKRDSGSKRIPPLSRVSLAPTRNFMLQDADALPQLIGDYKPVDQWQVHINRLFYHFRGDQIRSFYQTFASADYRLAHALAADYFEKVRKREKMSGVRRQASGENASDSRPTPDPSPLTILELGPGNGNLAACFLSHLKTLDKDGAGVSPHSICAGRLGTSRTRCSHGSSGTRVPPRPDRDASRDRGSARRYSGWQRRSHHL